MPSLTKVQSGFMEAQGALPLSSGTAAAPGLKFSDHAGTGMFSPSTGAIGFSTSNHQQALTIQTDGSIGVGIASPARSLHLHESSSNGIFLSFTNSTTGVTGADGALIGIQDDESLIISNKENNHIELHTSNTKRLSVNSDGSTTMYVNSETHQTFRFTTQSSNEAKLIMRDANSNDDIVLNTGGSTYFNNDHNFGLGMSNPSAKLHIQKNSSDADFTNETTPSTTSGVNIANLATGAGTFTALTLSVSSGSATQNASVIAKATSSGTAPEMHFTRRSNNNTVSSVVIDTAGKVGINETSPSYKLHVKETTSASNYVYVQNTTTGNAGVRLKNSQGDFVLFVSPDLRIYDFANSADRLRISNAGRIGINADPTSYANTDTALGLLVKNGHTSSEHTFLDIQNGTSESGRIRFVDGDNGIAGQIYFSHNTNRDGVGGNCMGFFTGSNSLRMQVMTDRVKVHGSTDGVLELDTTDQRGAFIRFQENESSKGWAGCSEGIGTGGDQDDFGIRAVGGFRLRTGANNSIEIYESGQIALRPLTGGFSTHGATTQYPGAAVSIQCHGVGAGTGTNIPNYGLYVDGAHSANDATLMTGVFATAKQNTQGSAIGIHGLYHQDWNSYSKKIGGLFQAPCRSPRNATRSFNPGGGTFANTTSTGFANRLASGGARPDGQTPTDSTYGDNTALWGDCFRSDTDTSSEFSHNIAIKATNRVNHGAARVGLMVGTVDGNDTSHNRRRVQAVEYYTEDTHQRFYNRNHKKEMNHHEPLSMSSTDGSRSTMNNVWTANYYVQKYQSTNQYSWYFYNTHSSSYARNGRLKFYITWTTGHASGIGEAEYSVAYTVPHTGGTIAIRRCTRFHQWSIGGSYYGWNANPDVKFFQSTSTGTNAGIYMRLEGAQTSFDGYNVQSIKLEALEANYGFSTEASFRWVSHSTPSDAAGSAETNYPPSTS